MKEFTEHLSEIIKDIVSVYRVDDIEEQLFKAINKKLKEYGYNDCGREDISKLARKFKISISTVSDPCDKVDNIISINLKVGRKTETILRIEKKVGFYINPDSNKLSIVLG